MRKACISLLLIIAFVPAISQMSHRDSLAATFDLLDKKPFKELLLEDTGGHLFSTSSLLGKTIYVDFWFTACAPCIKEVPFSKSLQDYFANDTNIAFLNICIENTERKTAWKEMVKNKEMKGINLFYSLNRPQKINLLREYNITFPTYLILNKEMKVIGNDAPRPSEEKWVRWAIEQAEKI